MRCWIPARHRRLPFHGDPGPRHHRGRRVQSVPARQGGQTGPGAADQYVPVRAEPAVADVELPSGVARLNGLSIHAGNGEWIWRPLNNPKHLSVSTYTVENPKGFGLLQRGRNFKEYEDLDDRYDLRPSAWIEPKGDWGKGKVELVEIPTADETNDNIVAFWTPDTLPEAKSR